MGPAATASIKAISDGDKKTVRLAGVALDLQSRVTRRPSRYQGSSTGLLILRPNQAAEAPNDTACTSGGT
ncbi:hypothetical protein NPX13_g11455 [Xylaria arbuscula]|uniref:Uncharacterized protein n=1 Tax=Xylaria arbuscula TaxID=114810 RepID=A0A9W8N2U0_9PEZI|nr:hypothetical protein NPX13_g11455 [Xylaria arbuscula]